MLEEVAPKGMIAHIKHNKKKIIVKEWKKIAEQLYGRLYKTWM
ncbi:MAG: hypothetical protein WB791_09115 [Waddliaceae bacterium]